MQQLTHDLDCLLKDSEVTELKWAKLASARHRFAAEKVIKCLLEMWVAYGLRVDTLIWDTHDQRHNIVGRDDVANFGRMYFHLLKSVLKKREAGSIWSIFPDEHVQLDWNTLHHCVQQVGKWKEVFRLPLFNVMDEREFFNVETFEQCNSRRTPISQACDLFAGMSVYSCNHYDKYTAWLSREQGQLQLFGTEQADQQLSKRHRERLPVLHGFVLKCKELRLGVSINEKRRLWTPKPSNPINFWHYHPQREEDKAPLRDG